MKAQHHHKKVIKNRFYIIEDLGQGGYGSVHKAIDKATNDMVAIKYNKRIKNFKSEYQIMDTLNKFKFPGFPRLISYGMSDNQNYIVTELLGPTLKDKLKEREGPFSMETVCLIGLQLLERLESFHNIGYIHLDLKPDNILLGSPTYNSAKWKMIYLIDFGVSRKYKNPDGSHVQFRMDLAFTGNIIFASVNSFLNYELSRRDDLESLMYLLVYFALGYLPWLSCLGNNSLALQSSIVKDYKMKLKGEEFCKDLPSQFGTMYNYVRHLDFEQKPDYSYMKKGLKSILEQCQMITMMRAVFDWMPNAGQKSNVSQIDKSEYNQKGALQHHQTVNLGQLQRGHTQMNQTVNLGAVQVGEPDQPQTPALVSKPHRLGMGGAPQNIAQTPLLRPSNRLRKSQKTGGNKKKRKGRKSHGQPNPNLNVEEEEGEEEENDNQIHMHHNVSIGISRLDIEAGPKSQIITRQEVKNLQLTPNIKSSKLFDRRSQMKQMQVPVHLRRNGYLGVGEEAKKDLITIKHATIYEVSHMDVSRRDISARFANNESFEVEFDSAEFDDSNINEEVRLGPNYEFFHNENNIKYLKYRSNTLEEKPQKQLLQAFVSFF